DAVGNGEDYTYGLAPSGILKPTAYLHAPFAVSAVFGRKTLVVGIAGLSDYSAPRMAVGLMSQASCRTVTVTLPLHFPHLLTHDVARYLATPSGRDAWAAFLEDHLRDEEALVIPPVYSDFNGINELEARLRKPVR